MTEEDCIIAKLKGIPDFCIGRDYIVIEYGEENHVRRRYQFYHLSDSSLILDYSDTDNDSKVRYGYYCKNRDGAIIYSFYGDEQDMVEELKTHEND